MLHHRGRFKQILLCRHVHHHLSNNNRPGSRSINSRCLGNNHILLPGVELNRMVDKVLRILRFPRSTLILGIGR
jgi:hypothetical protein